MSEEEIPQSRLRVGGWLPPYLSTRPGGGRGGVHRVGASLVTPPVGVPAAARPAPARPRSRRPVVAGAVLAMLTVTSTVAVLRAERSPGTDGPIAFPVPFLSAPSPGPSALPGPPPWPAPSPASASSPDRPAARPSTARGEPSRRAAGVRPGGGHTAATPLRPSVRSTAATAPSTVTRAPVAVPAPPGAVTAPPAVGRTVSLAPQGRPTHRVRHSGASVRVDPMNADNSAAVRADANFVVRDGLSGAGCVSFESAELPGRYLRHQNFSILLHDNDDGELFRLDATFCPAAAAGGGVSLRSVNYPDRFLTERDSRLVLDPAGSGMSRIFLVRPAL